MKIERFILGPLKTNTYLLWDEESQKAAVLDPADEGGFLSNKVLENELDLEYIVLTHAHFDHLNGLLELKLNFQDTPILMHKKDLDLYKKAPQSSQYWLNRETDPLPQVDKFLKEGDTVKLGETRLEVLHTPGHTPGSVCLYSKEEGILFSGDTLFKDGYGRVDFSYSSPGKMKQSLDKLSQLPADTKVYPGHGDFTYIDRELVS